jgi:tetratricopeptide (TPR) repeat protein
LRAGGLAAIFPPASNGQDMTPPTPNDPRILIGASIPRSGHHFLADMLSAYFGRELFYCEFYNHPNCCKQVPCTRRGRFNVIYEKSHDRDLALPKTVERALYIVQYRHPVPEALSDRELELVDKLGRVNLAYRRSRAGYMNWLAAKAVYYRKFHDKWIAKKLPNAVYLDYARLAASPLEAVNEIVERAVGRADAQRLAAAVEEKNPTRSSDKAGAPAAPFKPRVIQNSPYFDAELLGAFEDWVLERCPAFGFKRELEGSYRNSALYGLILLRDHSEPLPEGETKRFKVASSYAPDHPEIVRRAAARAVKEGRAAQAVQRLEKLLQKHPYFGAGYELLFSACAEGGVEIPDSALTGNAVIACSDSAELSMRLGRAFQEKGLIANAIGAYSMAAALDPDNSEAGERLAAATKRAR